MLHILESRTPSARLKGATQLLYLLEGNYGETTSEEEQLHWAVENTRAVRKLDGLGVTLSCLMDVIKRHDASSLVSGRSTCVMAILPLIPASSCIHRAAIIDMKTDEEAKQLAGEIEDQNAEVGVYLGILYFLVEICRADEDFGEELSTFPGRCPLYRLRDLRTRVIVHHPFRSQWLLTLHYPFTSYARQLD